MKRHSILIVLCAVAVIFCSVAVNNHAGKAEDEKGFVSLFNGKDLSGWLSLEGAEGSYAAENGVIAYHPDKDKAKRLYTKDQYKDFTLRFEFKLTPDANNGLAIRSPIEGQASYMGMEIQILDDTGEKWKAKQLKPYQFHGSVYGVVPAKQGYLKPVGEWNSQEVIAKGSHIKVILNGETILDTDLSEFAGKPTPDGKDHPGLKREMGHIGFLGHGDPLEFRNIRIKGKAYPAE